ncbi:MAG TPA: TolC family outer membrane protein [Rhodocyclaceae bacterium]|nr:TolC family outer membrane protein [Rhodocyclaceae bacterium]
MYSKLYVGVLFALAHGLSSAAGLNEVTERALAQSPDVRARLHDFLSSTREQEAARGGYLPTLDFESYYGRERLDDNIGAVNTFNHPGASLQLRQILFNGFATRNEVRRLGHARAARYYELLATTDDTSFEAARAYLDVQRYRQLSQLAQDNWAVHKEIYDQIEQRVKAGVGRRVDLEQAAGRLALAQANWLTETSNLHDVSARYERVIGETPPALTDTPNITGKLPSENDVMAVSIRNNAGFRASVSQLQAARAQTAIRRAANSPTFEARGSQTLERNHSGIPGHYSDSIAQVVMSYNLFRGGSDQARIKQAEELYNTAVAQRDKTCRDVRQTTSIAWNDQRKLRDQILYQEQHALSTEKARDAYRQQFDIGQRSLLDVLDTENELFEARRSVIRSRYDLKISEFRVLATAHKLLPALGLASSDEVPLEAQGDEAPDDGALTCDTSMLRYDVLNTAAAMASRPPAPVAPPPSAPVPVQCEFAANDWAAAWSARDLNKYLGYYSNNFQPLTRADQEAWKRLRSERVNKPSISVSLSDLKTTQLSSDSCEVAFKQQYRSNDYSDDVSKKLVLKREGSSWKIIQEIAPAKSGTN